MAWGLVMSSSSTAAGTTQGSIFKVDAVRGSGLRGIMHLDHLSAIRSLLTPHLPPQGFSRQTNACVCVFVCFDSLYVNVSVRG